MAIISGGNLMLSDTSPTFARSTYFPPTGVSLTGQFATYAAIYKKQAWVNVVVDKLAQNVARLPLKVYERQDEGDRLEARDTPFARLLRNPNPKMDPFFFMLWTGSTFFIYGEALWIKVRDRETGQPTELWPLHPVNTKTTEDPDTGGLLYAFYSGVNATVPVMAIPAADIVHFKNYNPDTTQRGLSKLEPLRQTLVNEDAARRATASFWARGARPAAALTYPGKLSDEAKVRLKRRFEQVASGVDNTGSTVVLEEGMDAKIIGLNQEEAQYIECVVPGTRLTMANGGWRPVESLVLGDTVLAWDETTESLTADRVVAVHRMPSSELLQVTTDRGRTLVTTLNHPYLAARRQRTPSGRYPKEHLSELMTWMHADELRVGDYLRVGLGPSEIAPRGAFMESWLLGALIGNGHNRRVGSIGFSTPSVEVADRLTRGLRRWNVKLTHRGGVDYYLCCGRYGPALPPFKRWLADQGVLGHNAHEKTVPPSVFEGGTESWAGFLSGHLDTDGTVAHPNYRNPHIRWDSASPQLIEEIQHLLTLLGIQSSRRLHRGTYDGVPYDMWQVQVTGLSQVIRAAGYLNSAYPEKAARLEFWANYQGSQVEYHPDLFLFDRVKSIKAVGEGITYGIEVERCHTHVTEGLVTHNTRKLNREEVCAVYDLPPPAVHILDKATYSNIVENMRSVYRDTMAAKLGLFESTIDTELRPDFDPDGTIYAEFLLDEVLRGDFETRSAAVAQKIATAQITPNEARKLDNLPAVQGGDRLYINAAYIPIDEVSSRTSPNPPAEDIPGDRPATPGETVAQQPPSGPGAKVFDARVAAKIAYRASRAASLAEVDPKELVSGLNGSALQALLLFEESKAAGDDVSTFCALVWALAGR